MSFEKKCLEVQQGEETLPLPAGDEQQDLRIVYLHGIRFLILSALIGVMIFIVSIEGYITVTSLVSITRDLGGFHEVSWIVSSYQLGFVGLIVISAKMSDIFGRKLITLGLLLLFTVFSGGCAAAQSTTQLIVLRAFQGLGGGGCYTLASILIVDAVPPEKYGKYVTLAAIPIAVGTVLGPIVGGAINQNTSWRWIFLFNVPVGAAAFVLGLLGIPNGFPYETKQRAYMSVHDIFGMLQHKIDVLGCVLLLGAVVSFTACFQEAGSRFPWKSAYVFTLIVISVALSIALLCWERRVTLQDGPRHPVLPWRFFTNRVVVSLILVMALVGGPMIVTVFQLAQRFQLLNGLSSLDAGIRILPYGVVFPIGSMVGTQASSSLKIPSVWLIILGSILQIIGLALLSLLGSSVEIHARIYGYQVLVGFGCGLTFVMAYITVPFVVTEFDKAVGMAAANQFRTLGSAIGLSIATSVFNDYTLPRLASLGIQDPASQLVPGGSEAGFALQADARGILSVAYSRQMLVLCGFAALQIPVALCMWKRRQIVAA